MTQLPSNQVLEVRVWFADGRFLFSPDTAGIVAFLEGQGTTNGNWAVVFALQDAGVTFPAGPGWILWNAPGPPAGLQPPWELPAESSTRRAIGIHNDITSGPGRVVRFRVIVLAGGQRHISHDPDIVLDPPPPG